MIYCVIVGSGALLEVEIGDTSVYALKVAIKAAHPNGLSEVDPSDLQLFGAKNGDVWLQSNSEDVKKLAKGKKTDTIKALIHEDKELQGRNDFANLLETMDNSRTSNNIDVLVVVPYAVKRRRHEECTSLKDLCELSKLQLETIPPVAQLQTILERPLPFRLRLAASEVENDLFDPNAPLHTCSELETTMDYFLDQCKRVPDSEMSWQFYYDLLLKLSTSLCDANGFTYTTHRNLVDKAGSTIELQRPDYILVHKGVVLLRGEEKTTSMRVNVPIDELTKKMAKWSVNLYGDLKFILGYATSGPELWIVAIEESGGGCHSTPLVISCDIIQQKAFALRVFYNLAFLLQLMGERCNHTVLCDLEPLVPDINEKRVIVLLGDKIERKFRRSNVENNFDRLVCIYKTLEEFTSGSSVTHLQTVNELKDSTRTLTVQLSPVGIMKLPTKDELPKFVGDILTALKHWHSKRFCHGNLRWRNVVLVESYRSSYWMLIDMDESGLTDTRVIDWTHQCRHQRLRFQHDLYQLGELMDSIEMSAQMRNMRFFLQSALDQDYSAENALTYLEELYEGNVYYM